MFSGAPHPASIGQDWPGSAGARYAACGRLDLLDSARVALISGSLGAGVLVAGILVAGVCLSRGSFGTDFGLVS